MKAILSFLPANPAKKSTEITGVVPRNQQQTADNTGILYRQKFEQISNFVNSLKEMLTATDRYNFGTLFLWYHTVRHILIHAFSNHPVPCINYQKVLISRGFLWNTHKAQATAASETINFVWSDDSGVGGARPNDR